VQPFEHEGEEQRGRCLAPGHQKNARCGEINKSTRPLESRSG
jgi:hypothetical protein